MLRQAGHAVAEHKWTVPGGGLGVAAVGALLVYEQSLVRADDLSQVKRAFDMNGYVGILYLLVLGVSIYVR